jgi:hypothetical protein
LIPTSFGLGDNDSTAYNGFIKDVLIYNRALTAEEVTTLYNHGTVEDGLVLNIPLQYGKDDDSIFASKSFVYDTAILTTSSGFDEFGYPIRYDMASEAGISYASGKIDFANSACFNGSSSNARIESGLDVLPSGSTSGSISAWFYQKGGTDLRGIVGYGAFSAPSQDRFIMTNFPYIYSCGYNDDYTYDSKSIEYNKWYHVVMVYENATEKCYLNGELIGQRDFNFLTTPTRIDIGWHDNSRYFNGNIANILFYNRALTQAEVTKLYNQKAVKDGLVLQIPLQEGKDDESIFSSKSFVYD